jgi:radical SAM protein with 4Fe4S-binding SPASM domain
MPIPVGNIRHTTFDRIWKESVELNLLRDRDNFTGGCRSCEYMNYCGGCRARAYHYGSDYLGDDPGCSRSEKIHVHR